MRRGGARLTLASKHHLKALDHRLQAQVLNVVPGRSCGPHGVLESPLLNPVVRVAQPCLGATVGGLGTQDRLKGAKDLGPLGGTIHDQAERITVGRRSEVIGLHSREQWTAHLRHRERKRQQAALAGLVQ